MANQRESSSQTDARRESNDPPRSRWQFGIASMLLAMVFVSVFSGVLSGLINPRTDGPPPGVLIAMLIGAPLLLMIVTSLYVALRNWFKRH